MEALERVKVTALHLDELRSIPLRLHHSTRLLRSYWSLSQSKGDLIIQLNLRSSANSKKKATGKTFMDVVYENVKKESAQVRALGHPKCNMDYFRKKIPNFNSLSTTKQVAMEP